MHGQSCTLPSASSKTTMVDGLLLHGKNALGSGCEDLWFGIVGLALMNGYLREC
jgi:hypothetical protein